MRVSFSLDAYYPLGPVDCCTPAVLLSSGDAWELERCDCVLSQDVSCGGMEQHYLLEGFAEGRWALVCTSPVQCDDGGRHGHVQLLRSDAGATACQLQLARLPTGIALHSGRCGGCTLYRNPLQGVCLPDLTMLSAGALEWGSGCRWRRQSAAAPASATGTTPSTPAATSTCAAGMACARWASASASTALRVPTAASR